MKKLVLIDGNAIIHRAYHAIPKTLHTRKGEQTNVVYGFATTLIKVLEDLQPEYIAASFDLAGPTFRHEQYKEYKATRVKADQELYDQIPRVKQLVEAFGIPIYEMQGFEADDVIGTITKKTQNLKPKTQNNNEDSHRVTFGRLRQNTQNDSGIDKKLIPNTHNLDIYIVSGDKDIFQLVNGNVKVYNLKKGLSQTQIVDAEVIQQEYNLQPSDFIDLKALAGDPSDNIPGVPGIGPKTATELIQKFDTLKNLYQIFETKEQKNRKTEELVEELSKKYEIKPRILNLLLEHREQAFLSQSLATIYRDVPIEFDLDKAEFGDYDKDNLRELFEELGFQSLLRRFGKSSMAEESESRRTSRLKETKAEKKDQQLRLL